MKRTVVFSMEDMPGWGFKRLLGGLPNDGASNFFQSHIGNNVDVYLLDSGITTEHSEFSFLNKSSRIETLADLIDSADQGRDRVGHGTGVASIIAGIFVGVAPEVKLFNIRISRDLDTTPENVLKGLQIALDHHRNKKNSGRPSLVNLSFVMKRNSLIDEKIKEMHREGMIIVCSAGDQGEDVAGFSPAALEEVITVAGFDKNLNWSSGYFMPAGRILKNNFGSAVDISAPSELINVAAINNYTPMSGTSIACAYVTGVLACMLEAEPGLSPQQAKNKLIENSRTGLNFNSENCNGSAADRILFNPHQLLKPRWDRTQSLLGVFAWGSKVNVKFSCTSRIGDTLTYELVEGQLPEGLIFDSNGVLHGELKQPKIVGDEPEYFNLLVRAKDKSGDSERLLYIIAAPQNKVENLKLSQGLVRLSSFPKAPCDRWCNTLPGGHPCCCVTAETKIRTVFGEVPITSIEIGTEVYGLDGQIERVLDFIEVDLAGRKLYSINGGEAFFTSEHPFVGPKGEFALDPITSEKIAHRPIQQLAVGVEIFTEKVGQTVRVNQIQEVSVDSDMKVYNLIVSGKGEYVANGFGISGKFIVGSKNMPFTKDTSLLKV